MNNALQTVLVIGYGNDLRSDDAVGKRVAEAVATWKLPSVQALAVHQLTPELTVKLTDVDRAIFVDAYTATHDQEAKVVSLPKYSMPLAGCDNEKQYFMCLRGAAQVTDRRSSPFLEAHSRAPYLPDSHPYP